VNALIAATRSSCVAVSVLCISLSAGSLAAQESVPGFAGANSSNGKVLRLEFDTNPPAALTLNDDANSLVSPQSLVFFKNLCDTRLDLVVADTNAGALLLYKNSHGIGTNLCAGGSNCPGRPNGLAVSGAGLVAVADTGSGGTTPAVWLLEPEDCAAAPSAHTPFKSPLSGGQFLVAGPGGPITVGGIADTAFVPFPGTPDLWVLTQSPTLLVRVPAAAISNRLSGAISQLPPATVVLGASYFGSQTPTAIDFIPRTAQAGKLDALLLATTGGKVHKLTFNLDGSLAHEHQGFLSVGKGPLGVAAEQQGDQHFAVVADRQQGRYFRFKLDVDEATGTITASSAGVIKNNVQNPYDAAINSVVQPAINCQWEPGSDITGCRLSGALDVHLGVQALQLEGNVVMADVRLIRDTRGSAGGTLALPGYNGQFSVPDSCRGFPLPGDPDPWLVLADVQTNVEFGLTDLAQVTEVLDLVMPHLTSCKVDAIRVYHQQDPFTAPDTGLLRDKTVYCSNPSRSITPTLSPFVFCAGKTRMAVMAAGGNLSGQLAKAVLAESTSRLDFLQALVNTLPSTASFKAGLLQNIADARQAAKQGKYLNATGFLNTGALTIHGVKTTYFSGAPPVPAYGTLLGAFINAAFFHSEDAALADYCPPDPIRTTEMANVSCGS
jgi:hypothetical protein